MARPAPRKTPAQEDLDKLIAWYRENKPAYRGEIHVTLSDETLRKFAVPKNDERGVREPGLWAYDGRILRQHHEIRARGKKR